MINATIFSGKLRTDALVRDEYQDSVSSFRAWQQERLLEIRVLSAFRGWSVTGTWGAKCSFNQMFKHITRGKKGNSSRLFGGFGGQPLSQQSIDGFTLTEVVVAIAIATMVFAGVIMGLTQATYRGEWAAYDLAAQNLAQQGVEQARASVWDPLSASGTDNCTQGNFPTTTTNVLDVIVRSVTNRVYATNKWTIINIYSNSSTYPLKMIRVDCTWPWLHNGVTNVFNNTVITYRAPAQ